MNCPYEGNTAKRRRIEPSAGDCGGSCSSDLGGQQHEVFLSFRGTDTRKGFTDYLYRSLYNAGVRVFRDNEKLHIGEEIGPQLVQGITQSKISIPVFSKNYAESKWCLKEFALMMDCRRTMNQIVLPIFYDVTPNDVQHQTGKFLEAFSGHGNRYGTDVVQKWRNALSEVGLLKGWELEKAAAGQEAVLVEIVVAEVMKKLKKAQIVLKDTVVGIEEQVNAVMQLLEVGAYDVRIVGIKGMGGIGKTTLANIVYNQIVDKFEFCCFLENIREKSSQQNGLEYLQSILVSKLSMGNFRDIKTVSDGKKELKDILQGKKVLILLDDVDKKEQLEVLGINVNWFGRGSRVIVTTRDSGLFDRSRDKIYETKLMDKDQALQLFCNHAFKTYSPPSELRELATDIVRKTGGLPLALEVIGGFLVGQERDVWESVNEKLQNRPHEEVERSFKISYDALTEEQKYIFLDIACFHIGNDVKVASYMWKDRFGFSPACDVKVLELMSLIKIDKRKKLSMHDQLRDFGRAVVDRENKELTGKRIWLWKSKIVMELLRECMERELSKVEALCLKFEVSGRVRTCPINRLLRSLPKLRFGHFYGVDLDGDFQYGLSNLRWLCWQCSSFKCSPKILTLKNLVVLNLSDTNVGDDWSWSRMLKLKVLDLGKCSKLTRTPDFAMFPNLERLNLERCTRLSLIDASIGKLKNLNYLSLSGCVGLRKLPPETTALVSLVELIISFTQIQDLPLSRDLKRLEILHVCSCRNLSSIPHFVGNFTSLIYLELDDNLEISELPDSIWLLKKLQRLSLRNSCIWELPESIGQLESLVELYLTGSSITRLPGTIENLEKLKVIDASGCVPLVGQLPNLARLLNLEILKINGALISSIPETVTSLPHLHTFHLYDPTVLSFDNADPFPRLETLPQLPVSLTSVTVSSKSTVPIPNLSDLANLNELKLHSCLAMEEISWDIVKPLKLQILSIVDCPQLRYILSPPRSLCELIVTNCPELVDIQGYDRLEALQKVEISSCKAIDQLPDLSNLNGFYTNERDIHNQLDELDDDFEEIDDDFWEDLFG